jgi:hypothetical protein
MAQDWITQLDSDDPKVRAQAVKAIALSGNQDYLKHLIEIAEIDPDAQLRDYAKKAAQHLFSSQAKTESTPTPTPTPTYTPEPEPEPISQSPAAPEKTEAEIEAALANPMLENEEDDLSNADVREATSKVQRAFSLHTGGQTKKALQIFAQAFEINPLLKKDTYAKSVASELTGKPAQEALLILGDPDRLSEFIEVNYGKAKKGGKKSGKKASSPTRPKKRPQEDRSRDGLIQTWLSFFGMTENLFLAEQEKANTEDTLLSVLVYTIATVVISMVTGFVQFQQITTLMGEQLPQLGFNLGTIFFIILIGTVIMSPISFYLTTGMQYLGTRIFGGSGDFKTHAYLLALVMVPATVLGGVVSLLAFIPVIGFLAGLAGFGISIFTIFLNVRLIKSAHNVSTGQAVASIIIPPIVLSVIGGCILMTVGSSLLAGLSQLQ